MQLFFYQDNFCYYFWKPAAIPSTFGKGKSFLDYLLESNEEKIQTIVNELTAQFGTTGELGLLNRLDTPTTGLLYFAKTPAIKEKYKSLQLAGKVDKIYLLEARGDLSYYLRKIGNEIALPLAHHRFAEDRMVVALEPNLHKIKGNIHQQKTLIEEFEYDADRNISTALVTIKRGIRHQIRAHFAAIGYPLVGDQLYGKRKGGNFLQLYSVGLEVEK